MFDFEVIVCTYNGSEYIVEQLESIVAQSIQPQKIIICDDGSTDDTLDLINRFSESTPVMIEIHCRTIGRKGVSYNFMYGLSFFSSEFVFLSDQDDIWDEKKVLMYKNIAETAPKHTPLLIYSDALLVDKSLNVINRSFLSSERLLRKENDSFKNLIFQNVIQGATVMINKNFINRIKYNDNMVMHDWWLGLIAASLGNIYFIPEPLIKYRQHANNLVGGKEYNIFSIFHKLMKFKKIKKQNKNIKAQAKEFYKIYHNEINIDDRLFLRQMIACNSLIEWQKFLLLYRIKRSTLVRTLSLYFLS